LFAVFIISSFLGSQVKLHFTDGALRIIAKKAIVRNTGARGLRAILENFLLEAMYEVCFGLFCNNDAELRRTF
jgi:ATP-dependent protease Clp ATPase subunit